MQKNLTTEERFWAKVEKTDTCWLWTACTFRGGYGSFWFDGKLVRAHRFAYELLISPIPRGLQLDHLCRVRACVNPVHLEPVTGRENVLRGEGPTAFNALKTHCAHGHLLDEVNTYHSPSRPLGRYCWTCKRAGLASWRARRRASRLTPF